MLDWYQRQVPVDFIRDGDLEVMAAPADFLGVNYYETKRVAAGLRTSPTTRPGSSRPPTM